MVAAHLLKERVSQDPANERCAFICAAPQTIWLLSLSSFSKKNEERKIGGLVFFRRILGGTTANRDPKT